MPRVKQRTPELRDRVLDVAAGDFSTPLQLLAHRLAFTDPVTGKQREFVSERTLET